MISYKNNALYVKSTVHQSSMTNNVNSLVWGNNLYRGRLMGYEHSVNNNTQLY